MTRKHGRAFIDIANSEKFIAERIWEKLPDISHMKWDVPDNPQLLARIIGDKDTQRIYDIKDTHFQNREMRNILSQYLTNGDLDTKKRLGDWIVYNWGGITKGKASSSNWTYELRSFDDANICAFIDKHHKSRISSWSKIIAFANHHEHAIYDSRTAMTLNVILHQLKSRYRFLIPAPRIEKLYPAKDHFNKTWPLMCPLSSIHRWRVYTDYIMLIRQIHKRCNVKDLTEVEMRLYAHAIDYAAQYKAEHGLPDVYPTKKKTGKRAS